MQHIHLIVLNKSGKNSTRSPLQSAYLVMAEKGLVNLWLKCAKALLQSIKYALQIPSTTAEAMPSILVCPLGNTL